MTVAPLATTIKPMTLPLPLSVCPLARVYEPPLWPDTSSEAPEFTVTVGLLLMLPLPLSARVPSWIVVLPV
jgi:hypothetical protein